MELFYDKKEQEQMALKLKPHTNPCYLHQIDTEIQQGFEFELWMHSHPGYPEDAEYLFVVPDTKGGRPKCYNVDLFFKDFDVKKSNVSWGIAIGRFRILVTDILFYLGNGSADLEECTLMALKNSRVGYLFRELKYQRDEDNKMRWHTVKVWDKEGLEESNRLNNKTLSTRIFKEENSACDTTCCNDQYDACESLCCEEDLKDWQEDFTFFETNRSGVGTSTNTLKQMAQYCSKKPKVRKNNDWPI